MSERPKRRRSTSLAPLPDPRTAPIAPPEPEHVVPPRLAAAKALGGVGTLGLEVALSIMVGLFGGQWLDGRLGTTPWITVAGFGFGLAAAVRAVMRQLRIMRKESAKEEALEGNPEPLWESEADRARRAREALEEAHEDDAPSSARDERAAEKDRT